MYPIIQVLVARTGREGRFHLPRPIESYNQDFTATEYGQACPQQRADIPEGLPKEIADTLDLLFPKEPPKNGEDCE
jgi:cholinesterase